VEHVGVAPERIDVVYHGVDHSRFHDRAAPDEAAAVERFLGSAAPFLLYLGAGDARKNLPLLIEAYAHSGLHRDVRLVLAGPLSAKNRRQLAKVIAKAGVPVLLAGYADETMVPALYRRCLAHVFPSAYEGFGLPLLEAMACGAPTVTTASSSLPEVAGDAALVVEAIELEPLAAALRRIVGDAELRTSLARRGPARAQTFTWERCADETVRCYIRALES
jgi:glycosyltransferase involved in cell wall biosynthesis